MAHPMKKDTEASHERKLRAMTEDYGDANPTMKLLASVDKYKQEGPEEHIGFGADSDRPNLHAAKRIRKPAGGNAFATYARGGKVKYRDMGGAIGPGGGEPSRHGNGTMDYPGPVKGSQTDPTESSEPSPTPVDNRARGGRMGKKGKKGGNHVNIMIAPQGHAPGAAGMPPVSALPTPPIGPKPPMPPAPPMAGPPPGGPPMGGPPGAGLPPVLPPGAAPPGAVPPGLVSKPPMLPPRKHGGRVMKHAHDDAREDAAMIKAMVKKSAMKPHGAMRAAGGRLTAGAYTGEGRLEKIAMQRKHDRAPQKV